MGGWGGIAGGGGMWEAELVLSHRSVFHCSRTRIVQCVSFRRVEEQNESKVVSPSSSAAGSPPGLLHV